MAYAEAQLAQDTLPQIEFREELRQLEMQQVRAQQKKNDKMINKYKNNPKPLEVISPGGESKYS